MVSLRVSLLHAHTHALLGIPGASGKPRQVVFSKGDRACGLARMVVTVAEARLAGIGAYDPTEDRVRFRVDFAVKEMPQPVASEKKEEEEGEEERPPTLEEKGKEEKEKNSDVVEVHDSAKRTSGLAGTTEEKESPSKDGDGRQEVMKKEDTG
mmetsp:Transcript_2046/g.3888  ORF Transcript_2046/g.3888 Transcript_2046/m.3888 type:complete len:153 (-) Transcript_2046:182-640(-)